MEYTYTLTLAERAAAMERLTRRASPLRLWAQTVVLAIVAGGVGWGIIDGSGRTMGSALLVAVCMGLIPAQWLVPRWFYATQAKEEAADLAAQGREEVVLKVLEDALQVGGDDDGVMIPDEDWTGAKVIRGKVGDMLLITLERGSIAIPHRVVGDVWYTLMLRNDPEH